MPRQTVTERVRAKLFELFRDRRFSKTKLAQYCRKEASWLSAFLHPNPKRTKGPPSFHLDELDDIAGYFRISIGELLGAPSAGDLSADEQRLIYAFRAVSPAIQDHVLAVLEYSSLVPRLPRFGTPPKNTLQMSSTVTQTPPLSSEEPSHGADLSPAAILRYFERLEQLAVKIEGLADRLAAADRSDAGADPPAPDDRRGRPAGPEHAPDAPAR